MRVPLHNEAQAAAAKLCERGVVVGISIGTSTVLQWLDLRGLMIVLGIAKALGAFFRSTCSVRPCAGYLGSCTCGTLLPVVVYRLPMHVQLVRELSRHSSNTNFHSLFFELVN
jgi:hypothetical protein